MVICDCCTLWELWVMYIAMHSIRQLRRHLPDAMPLKYAPMLQP